MSDTPPWAADRPLTDETATTLIAQQFPALSPLRITARWAGWDNEALEVIGADGTVWLFRFPKRAENVAPFQKELALLPTIAPFLPLPTPRYEWFGKSSASFSYPFAGYAKLPGEPAITVAAPEALPLPHIARHLGHTLSLLHAFPIADAQALGVPLAGDAAWVVPDALEELDEINDYLRAHLPAGTSERCRVFLTQHAGFRRPVGINRLLHTDLSADHLLLDPASGLPTAIIDWTDAEIGDPAFDFGYLWTWLGDDFVEAVLSHYTGRIDAGFHDRIRLYGVAGARQRPALRLAGEPRRKSPRR